MDYREKLAVNEAPEPSDLRQIAADLEALFSSPAWETYIALIKGSRVQMLENAINDDDPKRGQQYYRGYIDALETLPVIGHALIQAAEEAKGAKPRPRAVDRSVASAMKGGDGGFPTP